MQRVVYMYAHIQNESHISPELFSQGAPLTVLLPGQASKLVVTNRLGWGAITAALQARVGLPRVGVFGGCGVRGHVDVAYLCGTTEIAFRVYAWP